MSHVSRAVSKRFKVTLTDIEWDTGDIHGDGYDPEVVKALPTSTSIKLFAFDESTAKDWAMGDISDNYGFLIQGCKTEVKEI